MPFEIVFLIFEIFIDDFSQKKNFEKKKLAFSSSSP
jgi:hypothetical protein